ncbi:MAG: sugar transferase [Elusimicrobiaceae bacterium]|nr:sugar transferase [Elusimicrobiaceae bacterium]
MNRFFFFFLDFLIYLTLIAVLVVFRHGELRSVYFFQNCQILVPLFLLISVILDIFSFYDLNLLKKSRTDYKNILIAFIISLFASAAFIYFIAPILNIATPKFVLLGVFVLYFCWTYVSRKIYSKFTFSKTNILIFGKSRTINAIKKEIDNSVHYNIVGEYETAKADIDYPSNVDEILIASKLFKQDSASWDIIAQKLLMKGYLLTTDLIMYEKVCKKISKEGIKDTMWLLRGIASRQDSDISHVIKRILDFAFALVLLPFFLPVMAFVYVLIKVVDRFDPIFKQERVGKLEKDIYIYKFRTMKPGTENITRLGSILRRFRLDEVPQLLNILKGDISIVGPRPLGKEDNQILNKYVPSHAVRSIIKPGLTGWAQLNFKAPPNYSVVNIVENDTLNDQIFDAAFKRLAYDVWYIKNQSFFLDLEIILKTAKRAFIKDSHVS